MTIQFMSIGLAAALLIGCATTSATRNYAKPGFVTEVRDGRLWVFREGAKEHEEFKAHGELAKSVTRTGVGPNGMTIRAADAETLDAYLSAK